MNRITPKDFERMFKYDRGTLPYLIRDGIEKMESSCDYADVDEQQEYVLDFLKLIDEKRIVRNKAENLMAFEKGWSENYKKLLDFGPTFESLKPGYFRGNKFLRYNGGLVVSVNEQIEFDLFKLARHCIFDKYLKGYKTVCELGCGSGQNLLMLAELYKDIDITGYDWTCASKKIADHLGESLGRNISGNIYDMLDSSSSFLVPKGSAIVTIHAFEQLGKEYAKVLDDIIDREPGIVVQYEPILDLYDEGDLLDFLSLKYCKKRGYLEGYYDALKKLELEKKIEILDCFRPFLGGVLHESSVIVWRPL